MQCNEEWTSVELAGAEFGDKRLNKRYLTMAKKFDENPEASIPGVFNDWGETKAAYRFFDNDRVTSEAMIFPHVQQTVQRIEGKDTVLVIQDTSFFTYGHHKGTTGLGKITGPKKTYGRMFENTGIIMHTAYAVDTNGVPLGILDQEIFVRSKDNITCSMLPSSVRKKMPVELKESIKWIGPIQRPSLIMPASYSGRVVHVCDREADFFDLFLAAKQYQTSILVRAEYDRVIGKPPRSKLCPNQKLFEKARNQSELGQIEVEVQRTEERTARTACVSISAGSFELFPNRFHPAATANPPPTLLLFFVYVIETEPPINEDPLEWLLITDLPVDNFESAVEKVLWYQKRFRIETFHKILKSGFRVESCRISAAERLIKYLTFMSILSWRIQWMTFISRIEFNKPASEILDVAEISVLMNQFSDPSDVFPKILTVTQALRWIAQLGGFLNRKSDGEPGPIVIWRGWKRLTDMTIGWNLNYSKHTYG